MTELGRPLRATTPGGRSPFTEKEPKLSKRVPSLPGLLDFSPQRGELPQFLYRTGSQTDAALTDSLGVSFRDSISSAANKGQTFQPGANLWAVDTAKLPAGSAWRA